MAVLWKDGPSRLAGPAYALRHSGLASRRDWGWAPDYVDAMWRILQHPEPDDFVIATGETHSLQDFVRITFEQLGLDWKEHVVSDPTLFRPSDIERSCGNPAKAKEKLGWTASKKFREIISQLIQAEQSADLSRRQR
jgi:GDPmannose 4,6-dehydratase